MRDTAAGPPLPLLNLRKSRCVGRCSVGPLADAFDALRRFPETTDCGAPGGCIIARRADGEPETHYLQFTPTICGKLGAHVAAVLLYDAEFGLAAVRAAPPAVQLAAVERWIDHLIDTFGPDAVIHASHACHVKPCINPRHLSLGSAGDSAANDCGRRRTGRACSRCRSRPARPARACS